MVRCRHLLDSTVSYMLLCLRSGGATCRCCCHRFTHLYSRRCAALQYTFHAHICVYPPLWGLQARLGGGGAISVSAGAQWFVMRSEFLANIVHTTGNQSLETAISEHPGCQLDNAEASRLSTKGVDYMGCKLAAHACVWDCNYWWVHCRINCCVST